METKITVTVQQILPEQTGIAKASGKEWRKGGFVVTTGGQYPKTICVTLFGKALDDIKVEVGKEYEISLNIESREYNGRWYTEVSAWKAVPAGAEQQSQTALQQPQSVIEQMGLGDAKAQVMAQATATPAADNDDLPF